ncbi:unnamed protein product [Rhizophagus irregularis]|nr:unnamed protein product [Rhizophagus irregularis]
MIVSDHDCTVLDDASETIAEIASKVSFRGAIYRFFCPRFVCSGVQVQNRHQHKSLVLCCVETVNFRVGFRRNLRIFFRRLIHLFNLYQIIYHCGGNLCRHYKIGEAILRKDSKIFLAGFGIVYLKMVVDSNFGRGFGFDGSGEVLRIEKGLGL